MNEVPFLGEIGYVAPTKSFNLGNTLIWIIGLVIVGWGLYHLFISKKVEPKNDSADQKTVNSNININGKITKAAGKL